MKVYPSLLKSVLRLIKRTAVGANLADSALVNLHISSQAELVLKCDVLRSHPLDSDYRRLAWKLRGCTKAHAHEATAILC